MEKRSKNKDKLIDLILPNKRVNFFIMTVMILGIMSGSIFLMIATDMDKSSVISQIETFFKNIGDNSIKDGLALKNSLIINYLFVGGIWVLGLSMIGVIVNIFLTYIKGFLVGFSISSIILTYGYKGIVAGTLYALFSQVFNIIVVMVLAIYSIMFSSNLLEIIMGKSSNNRLMLKRYIVILMFCIIISFCSSLLEVYVFPRVLRLVIQYYL